MNNFQRVASLNLCRTIIVILCGAMAATCRNRSDPPAASEVDSVAGKTASLFSAGDRFTDWKGVDHFLGDVQPVFGKRCVVCHGCYDAPCSLKLNSYTGIMRGANNANPFAVRVRAQSAPEMRDGAAGFHDVVHPTSFNDSMLFQYIKLGAKNTTDADGAQGFDRASLQARRTKIAADPTYECPADLKGFNRYAKANPLGGMPFGLPRLNDEENTTVLGWIAGKNGSGWAAGPKAAAARKLETPSNVALISQWEKFLNFEESAMKRQLVARYIYEHLFNAHVHFDEMPGEFFQLVRSLTAPAQGDELEYREIEEYVTPLPTDAPPKNRPIFYRFKKIEEVITQKNHTVFAVSAKGLEQMKGLFYDPSVPYQVTSLPSYESADVFANFAQIPGVIRHRFMLENARYIVDSMVRAAVCTGVSATFAIPDHFWAFFLRPEFDPSSGAGVSMSAEGFKSLDMSDKAWTAAGGVADRFVNNFTFLTEYEDALRKDLTRRSKVGLGLEDIWDGAPLRQGGRSGDRNSWLSITRHDTSTTVQYGQEGGYPQSIWLLTYANFERLYYNLVVNFQFWGSLEHKLATWRNMSHQRMDGEDFFLSLLPPEDRLRRRQEWSGGLELSDAGAKIATAMRKLVKLRTGLELGSGSLRRYIDLYPLQSLRGTGRPAATKFSGQERADLEMVKLIRERMRSQGVRVDDDALNTNAAGENIYLPKPEAAPAIPASVGNFEEFELAFAKANTNRGWGRFAAFLPANVIVRVKDSSGQFRVYTIVGNRGYKSHNISVLSSSETAAPLRDASRDTVSLYRGVVGDYPELILDLELTPAKGPSARDFLVQVQSLHQGNYQTVAKNIHRQFGVERNSHKFWPMVDWLHHWIANTDSSLGPGYVYGGILDLSRYDLF